MPHEKLKEEYLLTLHNVYKSYGEKVILDDIDLLVKDGTFLSVVGPSGCGKSTFLRLVLGQEQATDGHFFLDKKRIGFPNTERGIVYQKYSLYPHLTVLKNVILSQSLRMGFFERRRKKKDIIDEAMHYLGEVHLAEHAGKYPHELSGGMRQRVAIVQALIAKPKILLMDEPFGALDPGTREHLQLFLLKLWKEHNMTIFFVTHDLEEAVFLGTRLIVFSQFFSDGRGFGGAVNRGARIVVDHDLEEATSAEVKGSEKFAKLIMQIRKEGFDKDYLQHATEFSLTSNDAFQTLTDEEKRPLEG
ncbi:ABC transporter ATP-binding protein [Thermodesulfobacteriota bacterium]